MKKDQIPAVFPNRRYGAYSCCKKLYRNTPGILTCSALTLNKKQTIQEEEIRRKGGFLYVASAKLAAHGQCSVITFFDTNATQQ